jgi:hypothetical protein
VSIDEQHVALPKLYGAPAYARPAQVVEPRPRPFDPDDLPIEAFQNQDERELASNLPARAWAPGGGVLDFHDHAGNGYGGTTSTGNNLSARPFSLRSIAGRLLGDD